MQRRNWGAPGSFDCISSNIFSTLTRGGARLFAGFSSKTLNGSLICYDNIKRKQKSLMSRSNLDTSMDIVQKKQNIQCPSSLHTWSNLGQGHGCRIELKSWPLPSVLFWWGPPVSTKACQNIVRTIDIKWIFLWNSWNIICKGEKGSAPCC